MVGRTRLTTGQEPGRGALASSPLSTHLRSPHPYLSSNINPQELPKEALELGATVKTLDATNNAIVRWTSAAPAVQLRVPIC